MVLCISSRFGGESGPSHVNRILSDRWYHSGGFLN